MIKGVGFNHCRLARQLCMTPLDQEKSPNTAKSASSDLFALKFNNAGLLNDQFKVLATGQPNPVFNRIPAWT